MTGCTAKYKVIQHIVQSCEFRNCGDGTFDDRFELVQDMENRLTADAFGEPKTCDTVCMKIKPIFRLADGDEQIKGNQVHVLRADEDLNGGT